MLRGRHATSREERQLEPALIGVVHRLVELLRISRMDEHRELESRGRLPDGIEIGVVEREARAVRLPDRLAKALSDLADAHRSRSHVAFEPRHCTRRPSRSCPLKVSSCQYT